MKKVTYNMNSVEVNDLKQNDMIYSEKDGHVSGMIVKVSKGYIHQISCSHGSSGCYPTIRECIDQSLEYGHTFFKSDSR